MRGNSKVITALNEALHEELVAINQYFLHAEMCQNWGYERLYKHIKEQSIDEMKHAEEIIERILFLEGTPNMSEALAVKIGGSVKQQLENDLSLEVDAVSMYNRHIRIAVEAGDNTSRDIFEKLLKDEEDHVDWLEAQLHQMGEIGMDKYLAQQIRHQEKS
jgi:bacterioferritin